jgi:hypothetical protein
MSRLASDTGKAVHALWSGGDFLFDCPARCRDNSSGQGVVSLAVELDYVLVTH